MLFAILILVWKALQGPVLDGPKPAAGVSAARKMYVLLHVLCI
jgi:hypothetical protein